MFDSFIQALTKLGIISEGMITPRRLSAAGRAVTAVLAVAFSSFFVYIAFFGPPISEIFKGTYILGTAVLCIVFYKSRQTALRDGFSWLDEIFAFMATSALVAILFLWLFWLATGRVEMWNDFFSAGAGAATLAGFIAGAGLYRREATRTEITEGFVLSDYLHIASIVGAIVWWGFRNEDLQGQMGGPVPTMLVLSAGLVTAVSMEIARRIVGPVIPLIGFLFLIYSFKPVAQAFPGLLYHDGFGVARVAEFLMLQSDGLTGLIVDVFANFVVIFVVLGAFLEKTGLGALFIDTTYRLTGQRTGGPGLTAVVSSGLFGMISGSGVANVVTTGTFTIPLMKRVGYKSEFAAAVEAAASTGGAYMPPIMGSGAFLLAQFTEISYFEVVKIAFIPAILYYLSVGYIVYIRAVGRNLRGVSVSELPPWSGIVPRLYLLLPIPVMVYYLIIGDSAFLAAFKTISLIVLLKASDLLVGIRTPWSDRLSLPFLGLSILFGVFVYFFGLRVGAPFSWLADVYRGIHMGDALFWVIGGYIILKAGELLFAASQAPPATASPAATAGRGGERAPEERELLTGGAVLARMGGCFVELVKAVWFSLEAGAKNSLVIGCIAGVLGILLSTATQSDLPGRVSALLIEFSFGLLPLTIFWVIVAGYIVGMGLPIAASYVVLVIFGVLSLTNLGVPTLTAHLISYWVAVVSAVTPPVALAAYAASAIALSDPVKTGFQALKLASWIFIMPFLFVYTPLLLNGSYLDITITVVASMLGIIAWASVMEGFLLKRTHGTERVLLLVASVCLLLPVDHFITFITPLEGEFPHTVYAAGAAALGLAFLLQRGRAEGQLQTA